MSVTRQHNLYAVQADTTLIGGITSFGTNFDSTLRGESLDGAVHPKRQSLVSQEPKASWTTKHIKTAIVKLPFPATSIAGLGAGLNMFAQKRLDGGGRASGATHRRYQMLKGIVAPGVLSVAHREDATLSYQAVAAWDTTNDPLIESDSVALPTGLVDDERYTLGKVTIGGTVYAGLRGVEVNFGVTIAAESSDSDIWPTQVTIAQTAVIITLSGIDVEWLKAANIPRKGRAATHANTILYLKRYKASGDYELDATAKHIKVTAAGLAVIDEPFTADGDEIGTCSMRIALFDDGTNLPILITTDVAIA